MPALYPQDFDWRLVISRLSF